MKESMRIFISYRTWSFDRFPKSEKKHLYKYTLVKKKLKELNFEQRRWNFEHYEEKIHKKQTESLSSRKERKETFFFFCFFFFSSNAFVLFPIFWNQSQIFGKRKTAEVKILKEKSKKFTITNFKYLEASKIS